MLVSDTKQAQVCHGSLTHTMLTKETHLWPNSGENGTPTAGGLSIHRESWRKEEEEGWGNRGMRKMRTKSRDKGGEGHGSSLALRTDRGTRGAEKWSSIWGRTCHWGQEEVMSDGSLLTWLISRHSPAHSCRSSGTGLSCQMMWRGGVECKHFPDIVPISDHRLPALCPSNWIQIIGTSDSFTELDYFVEYLQFCVHKKKQTEDFQKVFFLPKLNSLEHWGVDGWWWKCTGLCVGAD